jgi:hypothetical protein
MSKIHRMQSVVAATALRGPRAAKLICATLSFFLLSSGLCRADLIYQMTPESVLYFGTITGTITTDATPPQSLTSSDFLSWSFSTTGGTILPPMTISGDRTSMPAGYASVDGGSIQASTDNNLYEVVTQPSDSSIQLDLFGAGSDGNNYKLEWDLSQSGIAGNTYVQFYVFQIGNYDVFTEGINFNSSQWEIAEDGQEVASPASTPEPASLTLAMILVGTWLAGVGVARWRRQRWLLLAVSFPER